jgi:surfeit locus 1 family protein
LVVTPLRLTDGSAVVVQRGWVPRDPHERTALPAIPTPEGLVHLNGRIAPPPARLYEFAESSPGRIRQNLDLPSFARETGLELRPLSIVQEDALNDGLLRDWPAAAVDVSRHYGYAFQWFALSALVTGLYVWFQLIRPRRRRAA